MRFLYKPVGLGFSVIGGLIAGRLFKQVWRLAANEVDAPDAKDRDRAWREVVVAAALQGAIFGATKASLDRAGAVGFARLTGIWPGNSDPVK